MRHVTRFSIATSLLAMLVFAAALITLGRAAETPGTNQLRMGDPAGVHSPVSPWFVAVPSAVAATATPYQPATAATAGTIYVFPMHGYSGFVARAKYLRGETLTTDPVLRAWILKGTEWSGVKTSAGAGDITLADDATNDCDDTTYKYTLPSDQIDGLGADWGAVTTKTAAVSSSSGAVVIEVTLF